MTTPNATPTEAPTPARRRGFRGAVRTACSGIVCGPCLLPSLIALVAFGAIGSAVNGDWVVAGIVGALAVAGLLVRWRGRLAATACATGRDCASDRKGP